ncbi:MAG: ABC transporter permease [Armatimonadota bacterium]|nr:MAG: ABC transporter permease [Armatimonadota bacterium]
MKRLLNRFLRAQQSGLILVILLLGFLLTLFAGSHVDRLTGREVNNFLNSYALMQTATDACFFAIMAIGVTMVIISGGIDLSVGSTYAVSGVIMAIALRASGTTGSAATVGLGLALCLGIGVVCGALNGLMVVGLRVHPFIITLGTMWVFRGIAFVASKAESILVPASLTAVAKSSLGLSSAVYPVPMLVMLVITLIGEVFLLRTVMGRDVYAIGGNPEAARYCGLRIGRVLIAVYAISGLTAGIAAFVGGSFYGSVSCADATGYELYVIAAAVVGGASLVGGRGSAVSAMLGAVLIVLIRQSIRTLHFDQNYEWIIIGCAIIIAVVLDRVNAQLAERRIARMAGGVEVPAPPQDDMPPSTNPET